MVLTIYDKYGTARTDISPGDGSTQQKEVQGDNVLTLSFTHYEHIPLDVNDYVDFEGERYWLTEKYAPAQKSDGEWAYDVKFYGIESLIKRFLVLETTDNNAEPVFTLTATPREHVAMVVKCINNGMGHTTDWKVGQVDGTDLIVIDYEGKYCDEALKEIAEKVGGSSEWWVEGQTMNICKCEHGEEITLGYGNGLTSLERDTGNTNKFYTRLFPIGSTRNIDAEKYGHSRLMLPGGRQYVELHTDEYGIYDHYEKDAFSGIYPRRTGEVSSVRSENVKDDDGNAFTIYYFRDDTLNFDPNEYELAGETKRVSFQDGELAGLGTDDDHYFEVNFDSKTREFEIITIWPYDDDTQLPGGKLVPKVGNHYILWNVRMPDEYYPIAEEEFLNAVEKYNAEHWKDISVYKAPTDHVWVEENKAVLHVGRRVRLVSDKYFPENGYRQSRITKITRKVNLPSQMDLEISDALQTGALDKVNDSIGELKNYTKSRTEGVALPDIIRSWDDTQPTDNNLFSARRSQQEFISKKRNDRTKGRITFEQGVVFGQEENGRIDGKGNAELLTLVVRELLRSANYGGSGMTGNGWQIGLDEDLLSHLIVDKITVRRVMNVFELLINKVRSVGGQICVSAANGKIKTVREQGDYWHITFEQENTFVAHDLMRCQVFTGTSQKAYWVEVAGIANGGILVEKSEFETAQPEEGDECVLMGNTETANRQNLVLISASEDGHPRVDVLDGVNAKNFDHALRARLGNLNDIKDDRFPLDNQPKGNGLYADNVYLRGTFLLSTGEDIKTKLEITEGKVQSAIDSVRNDFLSEKGYLNNPTFTSGLEKWNSENETVFFLVGNKWIWANGNVLSKKGDGASVVTDMGRTVVRIRNKYILQKHGNLRYVPTFPTNDEGQKEALPVYLTFFYRCAKTGTLKVRFENVDKTGFANFNSMEISEEIAETDGYVQYTGNGLWNGTGDFLLEFDGDIYMYMLVLSTDKYEALTHRYRTLFEQSERLVKISAAVFDKDENMLEETGLITTSKVSGLYAIDGDGNLKSFVGAGQDGVKIKASNIQLEGLVTANDNFKILEDGSVETIKATIGQSLLRDVRINGAIRTPFRDGNYALSADGPIVFSTFGLQNNNNIIIPGGGDGFYTAFTVPFSSDFNGFRAMILNYHWNNERTAGPIAATAPSGFYFYEDGEPLTTLIVNAYEAVEMIGVGEGETFKGWLVLNRRLFNYGDASGPLKSIGEGFDLKAMYLGKVEFTNGTPSLVRQKRWNRNIYDNENINLYISYPSKGDKYVTVHFPSGTFSSADKYEVMLTGFNDAGANIYACVSAKTADSFTVYTGDDETFNAGGFTFMVLGTWFWT